MLMKIRNRLRWRSERGDAEIISLLLMLPISISLMLSFIDLSVYFNVRAQLQQTALNGARLTALYGGSSRTLSTNPTGDSTAEIVRGTYYNGRCLLAGGCPTGYVPPLPSCYVINDSGARVSKATRAGQQAECDVTYQFSPVVQGDIFGFVGITTSPFTVKGIYYTETGFGD